MLDRLLQDSIRGIARMAALRQKNTSGLKVFADVFSGSGENIVGDVKMKGSLDRYIGQTIGGITVIEKAPLIGPDGAETPGFLIRYACCGKSVVVSRKRLSNKIRIPVTTCRCCAPKPPVPRPKGGSGRWVASKEAALALVELCKRMERDNNRGRSLRESNAWRAKAIDAERKARRRALYLPGLFGEGGEK